MKETQLGDVVVKYFTAPGQEVFCEVPCSGIIDIMLKSGPILTAIELKTTFGLAVIEQAHKNRMYAHYSYVAVPTPKRHGPVNHFATRICTEFGIGILTVNVDNGGVQEVLAPKLRRRIVTPTLPEFCKLNQAGVQHGRWTSFGWFVDDMKTQLRRHPEGLTHKQLFEYCARHYHTPSSLKSCIQRYIGSGVVEGIKYEKGLFKLVQP
ncbi:hypothetical protein FAES_3929 [Fibrella aestuarina BUZ 2]|uniref:Uncharacterized protein n=1 Tax=Fibrella aestuarina BUZ 2 TaxID=1166018 RepID=I0KCT2_9BACT|nr:hypothetical protein [Fibrella aestuarina]CCH01935.1 hypothetical protein FAES_3929 [Fibrella aestuarina BUZ 2]